MKSLRSNQGPQPGYRNGESQAHILSADMLRKLFTRLKTQCKRYRKKLRRSQKKFSEGAIHEFRVETRRLLSLLELLGPFITPARLKRAVRLLKRHLDTFDELRDAQVQLTGLKKLAGEFPAAERFRAYTARREERLERATSKELKHVKPGRLTELVANCRDDVEKTSKRLNRAQATARLAGVLRDAYDRTYGLRERMSVSDPKTIHRTRVAFKKFRYMVETIAEFLPGITRERLRAMHDYQTVMGDVQDAEVLLQAFHRFRCKQELEAGPARELHQELSRRLRLRVEKYLKVADRLALFRPFGAKSAMSSSRQAGPAPGFAKLGIRELPF
jgi:CHAD domain-containing protein